MNSKLYIIVWKRHKGNINIYMLDKIHSKRNIPLAILQQLVIRKYTLKQYVLFTSGGTLECLTNMRSKPKECEPKAKIVN